MDFEYPEVPVDALELLKRTAFGDTGGSQAARYFLFWAVGRDDPTGYRGDGISELRRLDGAHTKAALSVLNWMTGPIESNQPLHDVLDALQARFQPVATPGFDLDPTP